MVTRVNGVATETTSYSFDLRDLLLTKTDPTGYTLTYAYDATGNRTNLLVAQASPLVEFLNQSYAYDNRSRVTNMTANGKATTFTYDAVSRLIFQTLPNGTIVTNTYDTLLRREWLLVGTAVPAVRYSYDAASRLQTVAAVGNGGITNSATYTYLPNSSLLSNIVFKTSGTTRMTTTKNYDNLNRLTQIRSMDSVSSVVSSHSYTYNTANQRTRVDLADGSYWLYQYDALGQVTSGKKHWSDNSEVAGQQFGYDFDDIGNREQSAVSGRQSDYTANSVNQYTQRTVPGYLWELGSATNAATVTINNQATTRKGEYFSKELSVVNSSSAVYTQLTTVAVLRNAGSNQLDIVATTTGKVFTAKSPELFGYDADGNTTNDGRWAYVWDGENRLIQMQTLASVTSVTSVVHQKLLFGYDSQSRRISKVVSNYVAGSWSLTSDLRFLYDGWNLIAEVGTTGSVVRSYVWGLDLSGSEQGAGGVGGLLAAHLGTNGTHFVAFDGNGNVGALVSASEVLPKS